MKNLSLAVASTAIITGCGGVGEEPEFKQFILKKETYDRTNVQSLMAAGYDSAKGGEYMSSVIEAALFNKDGEIGVLEQYYPMYALSRHSEKPRGANERTTSCADSEGTFSSVLIKANGNTAPTPEDGDKASFVFNSCKLPSNRGQTPDDTYVASGSLEFTYKFYTTSGPDDFDLEEVTVAEAKGQMASMQISDYTTQEVLAKTTNTKVSVEARYYDDLYVSAGTSSAFETKDFQVSLDGRLQQVHFGTSAQFWGFGTTYESNAKDTLVNIDTTKTQSSLSTGGYGSYRYEFDGDSAKISENFFSERRTVDSSGNRNDSSSQFMVSEVFSNRSIAQYEADEVVSNSSQVQLKIRENGRLVDDFIVEVVTLRSR